MHPGTPRSRRFAHILLAAAALLAVAALVGGHSLSTAIGGASGVVLAAVLVHGIVVAAVVGAIIVASRAHRHARHGNDGHGLTLHAPRAYDFLAFLYTLGREGTMRGRTLDLAGVKAGDRVLDVCCGTGTLAFAAQRRVGAAGAVHGIDAAPEMIQRAKSKGAGPIFDVAEAQALPFSDESFDVVTCSLALHHLPPPVRAQAVAEMRRVLKPGGRVVVVEFSGHGGAAALLHPIAIVHRKKERFLDLAVAAMKDAGFGDVESGSLRFADLGYARATK